MTTVLCDTEQRTPAAMLRGVSKSYRHFRLQNIELEVPQGTVMGLIGPNGAGKSTAMRILMGLVIPDSGEAQALGQPMSSQSSTIKQQIGYFSDDMRLYKPESIAWHMQFVRSLYPTWNEDYAHELARRFGLRLEQPVKGLSHGQRVKAMLLLILARLPRLLILDEPTNGLDPVTRHEVLTELMRVVAEEDRSILYSSHNTQDVEQISDAITFIDNGRVVASGNRDDFLERWKRIKLHVSDGWDVPRIDGLKLESTFRSLRVLSSNEFQPDLADRLVASGASVESIQPMTLEEVFVSTVLRGREES